MIELMKNPPAERTQYAASEIRAHLARLEISEKAAAARIGKDRGWLHRRLHGRGHITLDDVQLICTKLDIPVSALIR
jgi:antitoxin component HigA of HigAB toxin-antitoxin module